MTITVVCRDRANHAFTDQASWTVDREGTLFVREGQPLVVFARGTWSEVRRGEQSWPAPRMRTDAQTMPRLADTRVIRRSSFRGGVQQRAV